MITELTSPNSPNFHILKLISPNSHNFNIPKLNSPNSPNFHIPKLTSPNSPNAFIYDYSSSAPLEYPKFTWYHHQTLDTYTILKYIFLKILPCWTNLIAQANWMPPTIRSNPRNFALVMVLWLSRGGHASSKWQTTLFTPQQSSRLQH